MVVGIEEDVGIIAEAVPVHVPRAGAVRPTHAVEETDANEVQVGAAAVAEVDRQALTRNPKRNVLIHHLVPVRVLGRTANNVRGGRCTKERTVFNFQYTIAVGGLWTFG